LFNWSETEHATTYGLQIALDLDFSEVEFDSTGISTAEFQLIDFNLEYSKQYYWRVNASNSAGTSAWSAEWLFTTEDLQEPVIPELCCPENEAIDVEINPVFVWEAADYAEYYSLEVSLAQDFIDTVIDSTDIEYNEHHVIEIDLAYDTIYYWRVKAHNSLGSSEWSETWNFTTIKDVMEIPHTPELIYPTDGASHISVEPTLIWDSAQYAESYGLQIALDSNFTDLYYDSAGIIGTEHTITDTLEIETWYYWRVNAKNELGLSEWSESWSFKTIETPATPVLISPAAFENNVSITPTFIWSDVEGSETYGLQLALDSGFNNLVSDLDGLVSNELSLTETILEYATNYFWRVNATNLAGIPSIPELLSPIDEDTEVSTTPSFSWSSSLDAESYGIQISTIDDFSIIEHEVYLILLTEYNQAEPLDHEQTYYWRGNATNLVGTSDWSTVWSFTTETEETNTGTPCFNLSR